MPILSIPDPFHHRDHVRLAWSAIRDHGLDDALGLVTSAIRAYATAHGAAQKYHETLTRCWIRLIAAAQARTLAEEFDRFIAAHPELLDPALPRRHYSEVLLQSAAAREGEVEPDLAPLPPAAAGQVAMPAR